MKSKIKPRILFLSYSLFSQPVKTNLMAFSGILSKSVNMLEINLAILLTATILSPKALVFKTMTGTTLLHALAASSIDF